MMHKIFTFAAAFLACGAIGCALVPINNSPVDLPISAPHPWDGRVLTFRTGDLNKQYGFQEWTQHPSQAPEVMPYEQLAGKKCKVEGEVKVDIYGIHYFMKCRLLDNNGAVYYSEIEPLALDLAPNGTDFDGDVIATSPSVKSEYDKFKDITAVTIPLPEPGYRYEFLWPQFSAFAIYKGKNLSSPPGFAGIRFFSKSVDWRYLECHDVSMLADDQRIPIEETKHDGSVGNGYVLEFINSKLNWNEIKRISAAKTVEVKICNTQLKLNSQNMLDLKEFVQQLTPAAAKSN